MTSNLFAAALAGAVALAAGAAVASDVPLDDPAKEAEIRAAMTKLGFDEVRSVGTLDRNYEVYALMGGTAFEVFLDQSLCIVTLKAA